MTITREFFYSITACIGFSVHRKESWKEKVKRDFARIFPAIPAINALHPTGYNGVLNQ